MQSGYALSSEDTPSSAELVSLYDSVDWSAYTKDPERLLRGILGSLRVVTARHDGELVGLARIVGDGETIAYLQDILVRPDMQRSGLGRLLMASVFEPYASVRQKVLITGDEARQRAFYESMGFTEVRDLPDGTRCFVVLS